MYYTSREVYEFISTQTSDPIVERKTCTVSGQSFAIYQSDLDFYTKISPTFAGQKFQIPTPTLCPEERQRRRLSFRNERKLYKRKCDFSGKDIISIYSPDKPYKVYDQKIRWSDQRDPVKYGFEFDFTKTFTEQFGELMKAVPRANLHNFNNENCEYANEIINCKSSYLLISAVNNENCLYSQQIFDSKYICDCLMIYNSTYCFECYDIHDSYYCFYSNSLLNCKSCYHCINSVNLTNCIGCFNTQNKQYCIYNKQYTKEQYFDILENTLIQIKTSGSDIINKNMDNISSDNSYGLYITNSRNIIFSENIQDSEDCKYSGRGAGMENCMDCYITGVIPNSLLYECMTVGPGTNTQFSSNCRPNLSFSLLSDNCSNSSNLFGCIGLRNKSYCIFNKQYTKYEYEVQVAKIITHMQSTGEWGEFFQPSLSPFGYNETVAQEYFPAIKERCELSDDKNLATFGYKRSDYSADPKIPVGTITFTGNQVPSDITIVGDDIVKQVIICEISGRPFMIQKAELEFYRKHNLPLPRKHPDVRHEERMKLRPDRTLYLRSCDKCDKEMLSVYDDKYEGDVYCESCYQQAVYS